LIDSAHLFSYSSNPAQHEAPVIELAGLTKIVGAVTVSTAAVGSSYSYM